MEDVTAEVARLRARCDQARDARVRAEHDEKQSEQEVATAVKALRDEFGVETSADAQTLRADLDRLMREERQRIEEALG